MTPAEMAARATREYVPMAARDTDVVAVHDVGGHVRSAGEILGWHDVDSPTGYWSGIVVRTAACTVYVRDVRPGVMNRS